jgi:hypothetical protein
MRSHSTLSCWNGPPAHHLVGCLAFTLSARPSDPYKRFRRDVTLVARVVCNDMVAADPIAPMRPMTGQ